MFQWVFSPVFMGFMDLQEGYGLNGGCVVDIDVL